MSRLLVGLLLAAPVLPGQAIVTKDAYLPRDLVKVVRADLPDYLGDDCPDLADSIRTTWLRLNSAGWSVVIQGIRHCFAGANNGSYFVYTHTENGWRKILDASGNRVYRLSTKTNEWQDLTVRQHSSAFESIRMIYKYDGNTYRATACLEVDEAEGGPPRPRIKDCSFDWRSADP